MVLKSINTPRVIRQAAIVAACLLVLPMAGVSSAQAESNEQLKQRLRQMENELQTLNKAVYKGEELPSSSTLSGGSSGDPTYQANVEIRLNSIEQQLRDLTGKVEQQDFAVKQVQDQLQKSLTDMDLRFRDLEARANGGSAAPAATEPSASTMMDAPPQPMPTGMPRALAAPSPADSAADAAAPDINAPDINAPAPSDSPTQQNLGIVPEKSVQAPQSSGNAANDYEAAFAHLKSGNYNLAQVGFNQFIKSYPNDPLTANAVYWIAETYYGQKKYDQSARAFAESYKKYPKGPKAADSLLKLGLSLAASGKTQDSCVTLKQVKKQFATGEASVLRRTDQELKRLGCS